MIRPRREFGRWRFLRDSPGPASVGGCGPRRDRQPLVLFAAVSWILLLIPVLNLFPITTLMNDRYLYLPSIPAMALLVASLGVLAERVGRLTSLRFSWVVGGVLMLASR